MSARNTKKQDLSEQDPLSFEMLIDLIILEFQNEGLNRI